MDASALTESRPAAVLAGLDVDHDKRQSGKGPLGSRENPERYENVPGHVIPILEDEFDDFTSEAGGFLAGKQDEDTFIPFRLKQGVYGQRQADVQMIRVKLPFGDVSDSCKMGITASMGLSQAILERLESMEIVDSLTRAIQIKMSGCPNGCGQHHIGTIGFYGASLKVGERQMPAYIPHIGGRAADGKVAFGKRLKSRLPAKRVPDAVERWLRMYEAERNEGENFEAFAERVGNERFEAEVKELALPAEFSLETMGQFIDWSRSSPYKVERGEGECAI